MSSGIPADGQNDGKAASQRGRWDESRAAAGFHTPHHTQWGSDPIKNAPLKKSENILVFYQKSPVYHPQFTYGEPYRKTNPRSGCSTNYGKFERTGSESSDGRRYPGNVLFVPTVTGGIHPTQKPVELWWRTSARAAARLPLPP